MNITRPMVLAALGLVTACAGPATKVAQGIPTLPSVPPDVHDPPFARVPYQPLERQAVVAIAFREWRLWGELVDDEPPGTRPPPLPEDKPERMPGLWQRVGEYWWLGMNAGEEASAWTGKHNEFGQVFPASDDGNYAWSAAFVSYVMRIAGAGPAFPYSKSHSTYIDVAKAMATGQASGWDVTAERPNLYAPQPGDLICDGRGRSGAITYDDLPVEHFPAHCDFVVAAAPGAISVIGGNVDDSVTMKHVPVTPDGKLATPDGIVLDPRYPWMVVLRILYPAPVATPTPVS